jgi:hypothetical protein
MVVPLERAVELCPAFADVEVELLLEAVAPDLLASTEVLLLADEPACAPPWAHTAEPNPRSTPDRIITVVSLMRS